MTGSYKNNGISYHEALTAFLEFMHGTNMNSYSFDPKTRIAFCAGKKEQAMEMHRTYSNGVDPLYVIGVTNHVGMPDDEIEIAYNNLRQQHIYPFFGRWVRYDNIEFTDISYPVNHGIDETKIKELKTRYVVNEPNK